MSGRSTLRPYKQWRLRPLQRKREIGKGIKLCALCVLCVKNKTLLSLSHAKGAEDADFQSKLRCRWSSRWLRATGERKGETETETIHPLRFARPPVSEGQSVTTA